MKRVLMLAALLAGTAVAQSALPGVLTIRFLDVGQGDAVLITAPEGQSLLYDGGRSEKRMTELLGQYGVKSLAVVAASHADADHITGLIPAIQQFKPKFFLNNGIAATTQTFGKLTAAVQAAGTQGLLASQRDINLGSVKVTVLPPPPGVPKGDQNLNSVGLLIQYGTFRALLTGDSETAETAGWLGVYPASTLGPIDVYKSSHHGAKNGDNAIWLKAVRPKNVVIGVGPNNYGHPTSEALNLYKSVGAAIYRTDLNGTVTITVQPGGSYTTASEKGTGTTPQTAPRVTPPTTPSSVNYANCAAVRAAGKAPLLRGQPGYRAGLDRDGDGSACE
ncbi:excalibur calcium-binding domain-containing protein [Deinococcus arenicola]|uniref:Excalibur calcium-binding domain-containing protein n=1 Tax=Deinococcus arenicola TaxID=2994950 RepID=A0ABU4DVE3_9DEIO|nr:excalibur calcium-binding domain-containing protein [Deinococcus sp. ZS9-10]MDV6376391.1 excalibur calcium-binding domain-containing protein [Deinococcus sp. ZS9-10]